MRAAVLAATVVLGACTPVAPRVVAQSAGGHRFHDYPDPTPTTVATTTTVAPTTTTTTTVVRAEPSHASRGTVRGDCGGWYELVAQYDWPVDTACRVLVCESGGDPGAHNPSGANGLMQVLGGPSDAEENMAVAYTMWRTRGFQPWDASRRCWS